MKTPLKELIDYLNENDLLKVNEISAVTLYIKISEFLEQEKKMLVDSFESGYANCIKDECALSEVIRTGEDYFSQTFKD